jgi:F0F1-type ATP synthase beta subunit
VRRLSGGRDPVFMFVPLPPPSPEWPRSQDPDYSHAEAFKQDGFSEGTVGAVQTFFLRGEGGPWTPDRLADLAPVDTVIHLSREHIHCKIYPGVDVLTSRSRLLEPAAVGDEHARTAMRVREALAFLWADRSRSDSGADSLVLERALKLQNYFTQPFFVAEAYTKRPGATVSAAEALRACRDILDGRYDDLPVEAFYFSGGMAEIAANTGRVLTHGPVTL